MVSLQAFEARARPGRQRGASLIEILVTVLIITLGLLGLAGLQGRLSASEIEAYQRSQALLLLSDLGNRMAANRSAASAYLTAVNSPLGAGMTCPTALTTRAQRDLREWCLALQGAAESQSGSSVGAMLGGRGCVESLGSNEYLLTVAWQGMVPVSAPPESVACAKDLYNGATGSSCANDRCRRVVTTLFRVGVL